MVSCIASISEERTHGQICPTDFLSSSISQVMTEPQVWGKASKYNDLEMIHNYDLLDIWHVFCELYKIYETSVQKICRLLCPSEGTVRVLLAYYCLPVHTQRHSLAVTARGWCCCCRRCCMSTSTWHSLSTYSNVLTDTCRFLCCPADATWKHTLHTTGVWTICNWCKGWFIRWQQMSKKSVPRLNGFIFHGVFDQAAMLSTGSLLQSVCCTDDIEAVQWSSRH